MQFKKSKTVLAAILAGAMTCSAVLPTAASAAGTRTKDEAYGDETYAQRFMSLYDDVITEGQANGYLSKNSVADGGFGVPYHSVEELVIEAPDYGHETTSEALSYMVWVAAMRDHIVDQANKGNISVKGVKDASTETVGDLTKAWLTMEASMIPDTQGSSQYNFMGLGGGLSATYSDEWEQIELYPTDMKQGNNAVNPIHAEFCSKYGSDKGLYLMHWLADVDDWYGYKKANGGQGAQTKLGGDFYLINTFQRGEQESCWETIPHACVDMHNKGYGIRGNGGMKGFFNTEDNPAEQWSYTNAPDAEDRAIQAVYAANRWGVGEQDVNSKWGGNQSISALAGKMGDQTRNNMFDKYYKEIGTHDKWSGGGSDNGQHFLMNWYTSWGGAYDNNNWAWQIGASHCHEFYQNPLAAYGLVYDDQLNAGMKSSNATQDFQTSLERQIEYYLWLSSVDGPFAGGSTNSVNGRYEAISNDHYGKTSTFYDMLYVEHPVYADPGSNHWIGNQVWAAQRLAELYYVAKTTGDDPQIAETGMSLTQALETVLDKWVGWFLDYSILGKANATKTFSAKYEPYHDYETEFTIPDISSGVVDDGKSYDVPSSMIWEGQPNTWTGKYQENTGLKSTIVGYNADMGCVSSLANTLLYYAKAKGITGADLDKAEASYKAKTTSSAASSEEKGLQALYLAKELLDREWAANRDDLGLAVSDHNTNLVRLWETKLALPDGTTQNGEGKVLSKDRYTGKMPNGDVIENGKTFVEIRSNYKNCEMYQEALKCYEETGSTEDYYFPVHRFWHEGDIMMALGAMYELYPELTPDGSTPSKELEVDKDAIEVEVGGTDTIKPSKDDCTFESADTSIATVAPDGTVTGVAVGSTTVTVKDADGNTVTVTVTVTDSATTTASTDATTTESTEATTKASGETGEVLLGDVNLDGRVDLTDAILLNKYCADAVTLNEQQLLNADCRMQDGQVNTDDAISLLRFLVHLVTSLPDLG